MPKTTDDVIAESEIKDVHLRFCRANDRRDEALMRSCFHPDAVIELHKPLDIDAFIALGALVIRPDSNFVEAGIFGAPVVPHGAKSLFAGTIQSNRSVIFNHLAALGLGADADDALVPRAPLGEHGSDVCAVMLHGALFPSGKIRGMHRRNILRM